MQLGTTVLGVIAYQPLSTIGFGVFAPRPVRLSTQNSPPQLHRRSRNMPCHREREWSFSSFERSFVSARGSLSWGVATSPNPYNSGPMYSSTQQSPQHLSTSAPHNRSIAATHHPCICLPDSDYFPWAFSTTIASLDASALRTATKGPPAF